MRCEIARIIRVIDTQNFRAGNEIHCIELQVCRTVPIHEFSISQQYTRKAMLLFQFCVFWSGLILPSILTS